MATFFKTQVGLGQPWCHACKLSRNLAFLESIFDGINLSTAALWDTLSLMLSLFYLALVTVQIELLLLSLLESLSLPAAHVWPGGGHCHPHLF